MPKIARALILASLVGGLVACGEDSQDGPVAPPDQLGELAVGHTSFTAVDAARGDRSLLVDVWYPVDAADARDTPVTSYPLMAWIGLESEVAVEGLPVSARENQTLLVFSHGYGGINTQSTELMEALASHGFVVASPEHTGNAQSSMTDDFEQAAENRVPDVSFVIDTLIERSLDPEDPFYGRLDEERVGVVGHSFGGMTAVGVATGWANAGPDPRVAAIAPISAVIDDDLQSEDRPSPYAGFTADQLAGVTVPVMLIGGTEDVNVPIENNALAYEQLVNAPWVYKVDVIGANHTHFANVCAIGDMLLDLNLSIDSWPSLGATELVEPYAATCSEDAFPIEEASRLQNLYVVSFFRRHLLGQQGYDHYLSEDYADTEPAITCSHKQQYMP
ncbi:MAG: alpha/beta fold hydrolase [bacterium]